MGRSRRYPPATRCLLLIVMLGVPLLGQGAARYKARLATVPIDFVTAAGVTGSGSVTATLTGARLTIEGSFEGLSAPATVARLHKGPLGIRGAAVYDLVVTRSTAGSITGSLDLKPNQIDDLKQRRLYIQLHSEKAPDGNLWGWLLPEERAR